MKPPLIWTVTACAVLFFIVGLATHFWRDKKNIEEPVERINATTLRVQKDALENLKFATAINTDFPDELYVAGKISLTEDRTTVVPSRVTGRIEAINFASGESVKQGQLLTTLFSPDFVAAKEEYLQALKQSKIPGQGDSSDFANLTQMSKKKLEVMGLSAEDIANLSESNSKEPLLNIRAPRMGVIVAKGAILGNLVNVGDTLFTIGDLSKVWFAGDLYPEDLPKVHKGQDVMINVEGLNKPVYGKVSFISPIVDAVSRSIKIRALMDNPKGYLRADMYVQGGITISNTRALLVPSVAIVRGPDGFFAFKRETPKSIEGHDSGVIFKKVPIVPGPERRGMTAVVQGLHDGDEVVSDGAWLLDGAI
jgi:Cu(I)/Ag(I) efflux system membrane fusion protein